MASTPEPSARTSPPVVKRDDQLWRPCPIGGPGCVLVCVTQLGETWADDVIQYHVEHHHRAWR